MEGRCFTTFSMTDVGAFNMTGVAAFGMTGAGR